MIAAAGEDELHRGNQQEQGQDGETHGDTAAGSEATLSKSAAEKKNE